MEASCRCVVFNCIGINVFLLWPHKKKLHPNFGLKKGQIIRSARLVFIDERLNSIWLFFWIRGFSYS